MRHIVLPRTEPDLDGIACAFAQAELMRNRGVDALAWYGGTPDPEAQFHLTLFGKDLLRANNLTRTDALILVDASGLEGFPAEVDPEQVIEIVDHRFHHSPKASFPNAVLHIEPVGAAATLIVERFIEARQTPSRSSGTMLYGAIQSNTQSLQGSVTSERDVVAAQWLIERSNIPPTVVDEQFRVRTRSILENLESALKSEWKTYEYSGFRYGVAQFELEHASDFITRHAYTLVPLIRSLRPPTVLNVVDSRLGTSFLIGAPRELELLLEQRLRIRFTSGIASFSPGLLRKQLVDIVVHGPGESAGNA